MSNILICGLSMLVCAFMHSRATASASDFRPPAANGTIRRLSLRFAAEPVLRDALTELVRAGAAGRAMGPILIVRRGGHGVSESIMRGFAEDFGVPTRSFDFSTYVRDAESLGWTDEPNRGDLAMHWFREDVVETLVQNHEHMALGFELPRTGDVASTRLYVRALYEWMRDVRVTSRKRMVGLHRTPLIFFFDGGEALDRVDARTFDRRAFAKVFAGRGVPEYVLARFTRVVFTTGACQAALLGADHS